MSVTLQGLTEQYATALQKYLAEGGESGLLRAYELGRQAVESGLGVLDMASIHQEVLVTLLSLAETIEESIGIVRTAQAFFTECVSPFEMTHRSFREANEVRRLNEVLKRRTEELKTVNEELEAFGYSVSHDLRAPLRGIDGFSQALLEDYADKLDAQGRNYLKRIRAATERMAQLIEDLLNLSRVTRAEMRIEPVNMSSMAEEIADELRRTQPTRIAEFVIAPKLVVNTDSRLIRIVLQNLMGNAWKFTGKISLTRIELGVIQHQRRPPYFVRDNGAGFDMTYADKLFTPFRRLHSADEFPGTGIGLALVQRIIHCHGGRVWAEGKVGEGATFYFTV